MPAAIVPISDPDSGAQSARIERSDGQVILAILVGWTLVEVIINPIGDFPLNDDWCYGLSVKWLVEEGRLAFTEQIVALFTQVLWGSLFTLVGGFSFTVLRFSTIVLAAVGLTATYLTGREVGLSRATAISFAGLFAINPVFINLANTFMTDVPFLSLIMLSTLLLLRGLKSGRDASLWAGWVAVLAASLIRQLGVALPIGLVVAALMKDGVNKRTVTRFVVPAMLVVFIVVVAYPRIMTAVGALPSNYHESTGSVQEVFGHLTHLKLGALRPVLRGVGCGLMNLGLWMLPLLVLTQASWIGATSGPGRQAATFCLCGAAVVVTACLWSFGVLMPLGGNILMDFGLGPPTLGGQRSHAPRWFWAVVTFASAYGAASLVLAVGQVARRAVAAARSGQARSSFWLAAFLLLSAAICYGPFCFIYRAWFDRYLLPVMAMLAILLMAEPLGVVRLPGSFLGLGAMVSAILAVLYLSFAVAATHDYLAWNQERWAAAASLMATSTATPNDIQGGYEFDGYHVWRDLPPGTGIHEADWQKAKTTTRYRIAFSAMPGFKELNRLPVEHWLPLSPNRILVLEKTGDPGLGAIPENGEARTVFNPDHSLITKEHQ
jgi:4-amino-4-deoxy-L-arabinose transferase-like glycosyltransferase